MATVAVRMFVFSRDSGDCVDTQNTEVITEKTRGTGKRTAELSRVSKWSGGRCTQVVPFLIVNMVCKPKIVDLVIFLKRHLKK